MKISFLLSAIILIASIETTKANNQISETIAKTETPIDSLRLAELDRFWIEVSRTVREGDFEGYKATCHHEAVIVITNGENKYSAPMTVALARWKQGFTDTRAGKSMDNVEFRFSQRVGDETTAHETGIFYFTSVDSKGKLIKKHFTHFEVLLVKRNGDWKVLMEYQISEATQEEWDALK